MPFQVKIDGSLPILKLYITKEKARDLLSVINTLLPPPVPEDSTVRELIPTRDLIPNGAAVGLGNIIKKSKRVVSLEAQFSMARCSLVVKHNEDRNTNLAGDSLLRTSFL